MNKQIYFISSSLKLIIWVAVLYITIQNINIYINPVLGLSFGTIGLGLALWWASFFVFFGSYKLLSKQKENIQLSNSYKLSLLFSFYIISNLGLIIIKRFNYYIAFGLLVFFIFLQDVLTYQSDDEFDLNLD